MKILAIDPGPEKSAWVFYESDNKQIIKATIQPNHEIVNAGKGDTVFLSGSYHKYHIAVEVMISAFTGGPKQKGYIGKTTMATQKWAGIFLGWFGAFYTQSIQNQRELHRKEIVTYFCGSSRAGDSDVRAALIDRFPPTGGGKIPQIGIKKKPGPLYGIKTHVWSALALAVYYAEQQEKKDE